MNLFLLDSYDDSQVQYQWIKVSLKEHDMTEFYVKKQILRLESTSFITGSSGIYHMHSLFFIRMLFFRPRLNALIFLQILGWKYSCIIIKL